MPVTTPEGGNPVYRDLRSAQATLIESLEHTGRSGWFDQFLRAYTHRIEPEEESAFSPEFVIQALATQWRTLTDFADEDLCVVDISIGGELVRRRCLPDGKVFSERLAIESIGSGTLVSIVSKDMDFLVDTFLQTLRERNDRLTAMHPVIISSTIDHPELARSLTSGDGLVSFFAAKFPELPTRAEVEQLSRKLSDRYQQLSSFIRDRERMVADLLQLVEADEFPGRDLEAVQPSTSALAQFLPFTEIRRPASGGTAVLGIEPHDLPTAKGEPQEHRFAVEILPTRSEILGGSVLRALTHRDKRGEVTFLGVFRPQLTGAIGLAAPEVSARVEQARLASSLLPSSHSYRVLRDFVSSLTIDLVISLPIERFIELCKVGLLMEEVSRTQVFVDSGAIASRLVVIVPADRIDVGIEERIDGLVASECETMFARLSRTLSERSLVIEYGLSGPVDEESLERLKDALEVASTPWKLRIRSQLRETLPAERLAPVLEVLDVFAATVEPSFMLDEPDERALADLAAIEELLRSGERVKARVMVGGGQAHIHLIALADRPTLTDMVPVVENFGLKVIEELPYRARVSDRDIWIIDLEVAAGPSLVVGVLDDAVSSPLEEFLTLVWQGETENDPLNQLCLSAGLEAPAIEVLRALAAYIRLGTLGYSETYARYALVANPQIATGLAELFLRRFDVGSSAASREEATARLSAEINERLAAVESLDHDKILRGMLALVLAMSRTNFYHRQRETIAFKLDPAKLGFLPEPKPMFEIYVRSATTEAVHLRGGKIARGGIRFSDRVEDFRTEILGLMKAQNVKNAVIVPVGAKGGFIVRDLDPKGGNAARIERSYRVFMNALLSITDNLENGAIVPPDRTVRYDGDDHYLVVAADKGTAAFSDIANRIAIDRGFWLNDAFASGGSNGFDHKEMGITAKGAWVSVAHHFDALGVDVAATPVTVVGIGDMSGDVFGNGMLRSRQLKLVAAFDHRHIFLDPNPDPARTFEARAALFARGSGTSWADYPANEISAGGGVYPRTLKRIDLSPQAAAALGIEPGQLEPSQLIHAILAAPVDLLFNGGIGTYVKASAESNLDVMDKANDSVRVDGRDARARVIGEGGNLGLTQPGRIEYCLSGGRCNTDSIDNSAGVDTSDHEVNLKIQLDAMAARGLLDAGSRNGLLARCQPEVEEQVLADNVYQNWVLSAAEARYANAWDEINSLLSHLVASTGLDPRVEHLPDPGVTTATTPGRPLSRAELSIIISYTKLDLDRQLIASDLLEHDLTKQLFAGYLPVPIRSLPGALEARHPLRREIVATTLANLLVNHVGIFGAHSIATAGNLNYLEAAEYAALAIWIVDAEQITWELISESTGSFEVRMEAYLTLQSLLRSTALGLRKVVSRPADLFDTGRVAEIAAGVRQAAEHLNGLDIPKSWLERRTFLESGNLDAATVNLLTPRRSLAVYVQALAQEPHTDAAELAGRIFSFETASGASRVREALDSLRPTKTDEVMARQEIEDRLNRFVLSAPAGADAAAVPALSRVAGELAAGRLMPALLQSLYL